MDTAERGFSFAQDGPLDMRMGPSAVASAEEIVNSWSETDLGRIFREYGEERAWRRIASKIVEVICLKVASASSPMTLFCTYCVDGMLLKEPLCPVHCRNPTIKSISSRRGNRSRLGPHYS